MQTPAKKRARAASTLSGTRETASWEQSSSSLPAAAPESPPLSVDSAPTTTTTTATTPATTDGRGVGPAQRGANACAVCAAPAAPRALVRVLCARAARLRDITGYLEMLEFAGFVVKRFEAARAPDMPPGGMELRLYVENTTLEEVQRRVATPTLILETLNHAMSYTGERWYHGGDGGGGGGTGDTQRLGDD